MEATIKVERMGNNLGLIIPYLIANELSLKEGLYVNIQGDENKIIIEPHKQKDSYNLSDMLNEITESNIHHSVQTGMPIGNEIW